MHLIEELQPFLLKCFVELMYVLKVIKSSFNSSSSKERDVIFSDTFPLLSDSLGNFPVFLFTKMFCPQRLRIQVGD